VARWIRTIGGREVLVPASPAARRCRARRAISSRYDQLLPLNERSRDRSRSQGGLASHVARWSSKGPPSDVDGANLQDRRVGVRPLAHPAAGLRAGGRPRPALSSDGDRLRVHARVRQTGRNLRRDIGTERQVSRRLRPSQGCVEDSARSPRRLHRDATSPQRGPVLDNTEARPACH